MLEIFAVSGLINGIVAIAFGFLVVVKNWGERSNRLFFYMTLTLAIWGLGYWQWLSAHEYGIAFLWLRVLSIASIFIPVFFFHWVSSVLDRESETRLIRDGAYTAATFISLWAMSPFFVDSLSQKFFFPFWPTAGVLYTVYICTIYAGLIAYTFYLLFRELHKKALARETKGKIIYILIGATLGFGGGFTNFPLWFNVGILPYGTFLVAAFPFLLGYAALKHKLFSLRTFAAEILVFFMAVVLFIQVTLSQSLIEAVLRGIFFVIVSIAGFLLIKSVYREIEQREEIEKLSNEKSEFMTFASHEIRNPITAMRGYASLISDGTAGEVNPKVKDVYDKILVLGDEVLALIGQFLSKSKMELGQIQYTTDVFDLGLAVSSIADGYKPHAEQKGLDLIKKIDTSEHLMIKADQGKVKEVIGNIIDNSLKYTRHGNITVAVERHGIAVRAVISDTGVGIAPETLPHLFKKFSRADAQKVNLLGTGVGLYLAKTFIEAMGGRIWAESDGTDKGSRFIIEFPAAA